jgi:hypothetical protein
MKLPHGSRVFAVALFLAAGEARAVDLTDLAPPSPDRTARLELRRENVDHGTPEETTRTYLRGDLYRAEGSIVSFQIAFPDEKTDTFGGSPFNPRLGDIKGRYRFAPLSAAGGSSLSCFLEATLPTADPAELGTGKYQLSAGVTAAKEASRGPRLFRFTAQLQQTNSVAGDEARPDINYTKLDLSLRDIHATHWFKVALNIRADWEQGGKTGAVAEIEAGRNLGPDWRLWVMVGGLLWGEGVKGTYGSKLLIGLDRSF